MTYRPMALPGSMINCSWNVPIRSLGISIERSLKFGKPSTCTPSPHIRNWFPVINDPVTRIATPPWPWARHWSFSTTCINLSGGQSPANVLRMSDKRPKISFGPTNCFPENLGRKTKCLSRNNQNFSEMSLIIQFNIYWTKSWCPWFSVISWVKWYL